VAGELIMLSESHAYLNTMQSKDPMGDLVETRHHAVGELGEIDVGPGIQ